MNDRGSDSIALVLAGHGSHISARTAGLVWGYVDQLRAWGVADEITACFWKEPPAFAQVFDALESPTVIVVPVFTAQGYFTNAVIPAEMSLRGQITERAGQHIHYTRTLGEHPYLGQIVQERVLAQIAKAQLAPEDLAIAVIGHGTRRSSSSRDAARAQAEHLRSLNLAAEVVDVYLDDTPDIPSLYTSTSAPNIIAVPYFLAPGSHVTIDVPAALGIDYDPDASVYRVQGRNLYYTDPIGTDDAICRLILEIVRDDAGISLERREPASAWSGFPRAGADLLLSELEARGEVNFGELRIRAGVVQAAGDPVADPVLVENPGQLRQFVREEPFRPLPFARGLARGWRAEPGQREGLAAVVETVYPGALADWAANRLGKFETESLATIAGRQQGMFRDVHQTPLAEIEAQVRQVCGDCVRHATWFHGQTPESLIPCKAACNWWLSALKEGSDD